MNIFEGRRRLSLARTERLLLPGNFRLHSALGESQTEHDIQDRYDNFRTAVARGEQDFKSGRLYYPYIFNLTGAAYVLLNPVLREIKIISEGAQYNGDKTLIVSHPAEGGNPTKGSIFARTVDGVELAIAVQFMPYQS